jgi:positive regulator of sigma E activity
MAPTDRDSGCQGCSASSACGVRVLGKVLGRKSIAPIKNEPQALTPVKVVSAAALAYSVPLLGFIIFALLGVVVFKAEWQVVVCALVGLLGGGLVTRLILRRTSQFFHT